MATPAELSCWASRKGMAVQTCAEQEKQQEQLTQAKALSYLRQCATGCSNSVQLPGTLLSRAAVTALRLCALQQAVA